MNDKVNVENLVLVTALLLIIMTPSGCACKDGSKSKERKYVNVKDSVGQEQNKDETTFSVSLLKDTSWVADYSDSDREYRIAFTDTAYVTSISFVKLKRVYNNIYPFYLSDAVAKSFDEVKVGKNTKGNYLVFYNKNNTPIRDNLMA